MPSSRDNTSRHDACRPCTGARRRDFLLGIPSWPARRGTCPVPVLGAQEVSGSSRRVGPPDQPTMRTNRRVASGTGMVSLQGVSPKCERCLTYSPFPITCAPLGRSACGAFYMHSFPSGSSHCSVITRILSQLGRENFPVSYPGNSPACHGKRLRNFLVPGQEWTVSLLIP
jgi:hypothetical protein